jgi:hypothetical protein
MVLDKYEQQSLLFNMNFKEACSEAGMFAYRGELVLIEGEIADSQGRRKPPVAISRHTVLLEKDDKLVMAVGFIDDLNLLGNFVEKYGADFAPDMCALFYVVNITAPMQLEMAGVNFILIPLTDGIAWNEMTEELGLEKSDFKGQSAADKIVTAYDELKTYKPKYAAVASYDEALGMTADIKRETRGAI